MVDMNTLSNLLVTIFLLMAAGYVMTKIGILPVSARGPMTDLVIDFILPCNIIVSFIIELNTQILKECLSIFIVSTILEAASIVIGHYFFSRKDKKQHTVLKYATMVSNAGFLGNPVVEGLYGAQGLLYASIYLIPVRTMMWSAGVSMFSNTENMKPKELIKKVLTHPCIVAVIIGLFLMITQISLPAGIEKTLRTAANCNTAFCMIVIGNILAEINLKEIVSKQAIWYSAVRLLIIPFFVLLGCKMAHLPALVTESSTVLAGMPAAASTAILASKYDGDAHLAVKLIALSTLLSLVTIPALCVLMMYWL